MYCIFISSNYRSFNAVQSKTCKGNFVRKTFLTMKLLNKNNIFEGAVVLTTSWLIIYIFLSKLVFRLYALLYFFFASARQFHV